jgi:hippurate hydrolase
MNCSLALDRPAMMLVLLLAFNVQPALAQDKAAEWKAVIVGHVSGIYAQLGTLYQDLHASPELAIQEVKTAVRLASEMRALGSDVVEHRWASDEPGRARLPAFTLSRERE